MPTLTLELELELELELLEDDELLLDELELELFPALPPALELEAAAALRPSLRLLPGICMTMPASMGARPRAIVISQRVRFIRSLRAIGLRTTASTQSEDGRAQKPTTTRVSNAIAGN